MGGVGGGVGGWVGGWVEWGGWVGDQWLAKKQVGFCFQVFIISSTS